MDVNGVAEKVRELDWLLDVDKPATVVAPPIGEMDEAEAWLRDSRAELRAGLDEHGAVYVRGLPMQTVDDFARLRDVLIQSATPYREKATKRSDFGNSVFSSTDLPPAQRINLHNENSYTTVFPGILLFGCLVAPASGGATPVADCRRVLRALPDEIVERGRKHGWVLSRTYSEEMGLSWSTSFATASVAQVEAYCEENGIACSWTDDGELKTSQLRSAIITHPRTGDESWFNHLAFWNVWTLPESIRETLVDELGVENLPFNTSFGDGEDLVQADMDRINEAYERTMVRRSWQAGDLLLVDNLLAAHGRESFQGDRKILVAMGEPVSVADCQPTVRIGAGR
jgi:alpha-ketoglutarate-dependent taurine dioxygenase